MVQGLWSDIWCLLFHTLEYSARIGVIYGVYPTLPSMGPIRPHQPLSATPPFPPTPTPPPFSIFQIIFITILNLACGASNVIKVVLNLAPLPKMSCSVLTTRLLDGPSSNAKNVSRFFQQISAWKYLAMHCNGSQEFFYN